MARLVGSRSFAKARELNMGNYLRVDLLTINSIKETILTRVMVPILCSLVNWWLRSFFLSTCVTLQRDILRLIISVPVTQTPRHDGGVTHTWSQFLSR